MHVSMVFVILMNGVFGSPVTAFYKYEEYEVEHQISNEEARKAINSIDTSSVVIPYGCQQCTQAEINYCLGSNLIADHCCCDKRHNENLLFISHTCYRGPQLCKPVIGDCITYSRLRKCCCDRHLIEKWKEKSSSDVSTLERFDSLTLVLLTCTYFVNKLFK